MHILKLVSRKHLQPSCPVQTFVYKFVQIWSPSKEIDKNVTVVREVRDGASEKRNYKSWHSRMNSFHFLVHRKFYRK